MRRAENPSPRQASARRGVLHSMYGPDRAARASFEERRRNAPRKCTGVFALAETTSKTRHSHGSFLDLATDMGTTTWTTAGRTASRRNEARKCTSRLRPAKTTPKSRHPDGPSLDAAVEAGTSAKTCGATTPLPAEATRENAPVRFGFGTREEKNAPRRARFFGGGPCGRPARTAMRRSKASLIRRRSPSRPPSPWRGRPRERRSCDRDRRCGQSPH